ncbi:MAG TPA: hypothetical protein VLA92_03305 [Candidatus Saccharimonadales bacterium]|nr:hypothetical protein [Candidatus Saccharimonadales bacterium]
MLKSPEWLGEFARGAKCDGVEYMPVLDLLPGHTPHAIAVAIRLGGLDVHSYHQTFRETRASRNTSKMPGDPENAKSLKGAVLNSPLGRLIIAGVTESAEVIGDIQRRRDEYKPVVFYPQTTSRRDKAMIKASETKHPLFQPTDHTARHMGAANLEEFGIHAEGVRGYSYVWDTFHGRRQYGREEPGIISRTKDSLPYLAGRTTAIHLSLNRTDIPGEGHIPTLQEAQNALKGVYVGELGDNLQTLKCIGEVQYVVIESTLGAMAAASGVTQLPDIQKAYADVAEGFREFWKTA